MAGAQHNSKDDDLRDELLKFIDYDRLTGFFTWKLEQPIRNGISGRRAGCIGSEGYLIIGFRRRVYYAHRLAWLIVHGSFPPNEIDHVDGDKINNAIKNLREATQPENQQNKASANANSLSGVRGVSPKKGKWRARIEHNGKTHHLGTFDSIDMARAAYEAARKLVHPFCGA